MIGADDEPIDQAPGRQAFYYTRCPVPTATGIALDQGIFDQLYAGTRHVLRDIAELGGKNAEAHYTHSIDRCFREGGGAPPVWARAGGADSCCSASRSWKRRWGSSCATTTPRRASWT